MSKCRSSLLTLQPLAHPPPDNIKSAAGFTIGGMHVSAHRSQRFVQAGETAAQAWQDRVGQLPLLGSKAAPIVYARGRGPIVSRIPSPNLRSALGPAVS